MIRETLGRLSRLIWRSVLRRVDARADEILERIERLEASVGARVQPQMEAAVARLRDDVWHSKVVNVGKYLLVGSRHLSLIFLIDPDDRLIGPRFVLEGEYEPETTAFFLANVRPDSVCIDVGANFGYYTCLLGQLAWNGKVVSFEPDPLVYEQLRDNVFINWCENVVEPINAAVGKSTETISLYRRSSRSGNTGVIRPTKDDLEFLNEAEPEEFEISCVPLDSLADRLERVDFIKIDVEGAETMVVSGMRELVLRHRPTIVMEWSPAQAVRAGHSLSELASMLEAMCLEPHTLSSNGVLSPLSYPSLVGLSFQNIVLLPGTQSSD